MHTYTFRHHDNDVIMGAIASQITRQPHDCLLNSKKTSKLRVTGLCAGNSPGTGEFPAQMASHAENVSIWWRHHDEKDRRLCSYHIIVIGQLIISLSPGRCGCHLKSVNFKHNLGNDISSIQVNITLEWMPEDFFDVKSALVQVMAWCHRVTGHYLNQCWFAANPTLMNIYQCVACH